ncbi:MAG TPA: OsmC family protein [Verrucomicrobiae bacterium]|nr:OsmC family protein [Verrucomicrobiae bacterium]
MTSNQSANTGVLDQTVNGVAVSDLFKTVNVVKANPAIAKFKFRVQNQWGEGGQNSSIADTFYGAGQENSRRRPFVLAADEPPLLLGKDAAANPTEYLLHSLAACLTTSMVYHAAARGIQIEEIESSLEGDVDLHGFLALDQNVRNGFQGIRVKFKIKADVPDAVLQEICQLGPERSPVYDSLTNGVPISVTAERM